MAGAERGSQCDSDNRGLNYEWREYYCFWGDEWTEDDVEDYRERRRRYERQKAIEESWLRDDDED